MATYTIGRSDDNSIVLGDTTVSRQHAELETRKRGAYVLRDLDSTYGTRIYRDGEWLNIIEVEVNDDTEVTFGEYRTTIGEIVAMAGAAAATAKPEAPSEPQPEPAAAPAAAPAPEPTPAPKPAPSPAPSGTAATGMDKRMTMMVLIGGGALLLIVAVVVVVVLLTGGSASTNDRAALAPPSSATRASFEAALVKSCSGRGRYDDSQCRCIAKHMSDALTREELAIFVALRSVRKDKDKVREIMQRYGATKVAAIGAKMIGVVGKVRKQCGVSLKR
jgi:hypothetical protein